MKLYIDKQDTSTRLYLQEDETFNKRFDPSTGVETLSLWVTPNRFPAFDLASRRGNDVKGIVAYFACCWIGRAADLERCTACAVRQHEDGRIEVRLQFGPPWWWSQINVRTQVRTAEVERAVDTVRS